MAATTAETHACIITCVVKCVIYYIELKAICSSVCLSVCPSAFWHVDNSAVCALIEMGLALNESCVFEEQKVYFCKPTKSTIHRQQQECIKDEGVSSH